MFRTSKEVSKYIYYLLERTGLIKDNNLLNVNNVILFSNDLWYLMFNLFTPNILNVRHYKN